MTKFKHCYFSFVGSTFEYNEAFAAMAVEKGYDWRIGFLITSAMKRFEFSARGVKDVEDLNSWHPINLGIDVMRHCIGWLTEEDYDKLYDQIQENDFFLSTDAYIHIDCYAVIEWLKNSEYGTSQTGAIEE